MVGQFWEGFFRIIVVVQVCCFFSQLGHIKWWCALVFHFSDFFWIFCAVFKLWSTRRAWPSLARGCTLQSCGHICDEMTCCASKYDFCEKSGGSYAAAAVQFLHDSKRIGRKLSFSRPLRRKGIGSDGRWIVHTKCPSIFENWAGAIIKQWDGRCFTKSPISDTRKMKSAFFVQRKPKLQLAT